MSFTEQLNNLFETVSLSIINRVRTIGKESQFSDNKVIEIQDEEFQFNLGGSAYLVEVSERFLINNEGMEHHYSLLEYEELFALADYINTL